MALYFTSDFHLGDAVATQLMKRPFKSYQRMTEVLIANANNRAKSKSDTIIHVGDFVSYGSDRGIEGARISGAKYLEQFKANMILLEGNHDKNNNVNPVGKRMFLDLSKEIREVSVSHYPSWYQQNMNVIQRFPGHVHLCGHVHEAWKYMIDDRGVININVGVDAWNYQIVSVQDILKLISKIKKNG